MAVCSCVRLVLKIIDKTTPNIKSININIALLYDGNNDNAILCYESVVWSQYKVT